MGIATFLVAFVPGYASIGIWGAIILTLLRLLQGIGVGGEWGGSVLLAMEWARTTASAAWSPRGRNSACRAACSCQSRRAGGQRDVGRRVPDLGLAHAFPA